MTRVECRKCKGTGRIEFGSGPAPCTGCGGRGTVGVYPKLTVGQRCALAHGAMVTITRVRRGDNYSARTDGMSFDMDWHASQIEPAE